MTPFNNELQVGQPAMIINVELEENRSEVGTTVIVLGLMSTGESQEYFIDADFKVNKPYAVIDDGTDGGRNGEIAILQKYLMPLPPLGDVYDDEMTDVLENLKVTA